MTSSRSRDSSAEDYKGPRFVTHELGEAIAQELARFLRAVEQDIYRDPRQAWETLYAETPYGQLDGRNWPDAFFEGERGPVRDLLERLAQERGILGLGIAFRPERHEEFEVQALYAIRVRENFRMTRDHIEWRALDIARTRADRRAP